MLTLCGPEWKGWSVSEAKDKNLGQIDMFQRAMSVAQISDSKENMAVKRSSNDEPAPFGWLLSTKMSCTWNCNWL